MKCKIFNIRLSKNYFESDTSILNKFLENIKIVRIFSSFLSGNIPFWSILIFYEQKTEEVKSTKASIEEIILAPEEEEIYEALRRWRNKQAMEEIIPPYIIAHNSWLKKIVKVNPKTKEDLLSIKGFGKKRVEKYGDEIIKILNSFRIYDSF
jgi:superfamily II DNA helicase RecQ